MTLDLFVSFVDLTLIVTAIAMLSYGVFRAYHRYRQSLPSGGILIACGLLIVVFAHLSDLALQLLQPTGNGAARGFSSTLYSSAWYDWMLSRVAFALIAIGFVISVLNRRQTEKELRFSVDELKSLRTVGDEADERFGFLFDNTPNAVYCCKFDPPMPIDLPVKEQVERSIDATLIQCNSVFAGEFGSATPADLTGRRVASLDRGIDASEYAANFRAFVQNDYRFSDFEVNYRGTDGRDRALSASAMGIVNDGALERIWVVETDVLDLRETKFALERRQAFLELIAWISSQLVTASNDAADKVVEQCIGEICGYFEADQSLVFWIDDGEKLSATIDHSWSTQGKPYGSLLPLDLYPGIVARLLENSPVLIDAVSAFPDDFKVDRKELARIDVHALMVLPIVVADSVVGGMTFSRVLSDAPWSDDDVQDAIVLSEMAANFILRLKSHRELNEALLGLQHATERLEAENVYLREEVEPGHGFTEIIGESNAVLRSLQLVEQVAGTRTPVLILGETGTGKELIARAIHELSERGDRPLIKVNCAALPVNLIESELFGHEKGAFTGANNSKQGRFDLANGSTLFLDEVAEIPVELQAKLLRVLQEGEFDRLGGTGTVKVDVRILLATNRDLGIAVQDGQFRSDLYYRINTFPIELPALRDRGSDIDLLARHFVKVHAQRLDREVQQISAEMMRQLRAYSWPGNVRELEGIIQRALISCNGPILDLIAPLVSPALDDGMPRIVSSSIADLKLVERDHIVSVLEQARWKISGETGAASQLGIPPSTLRSKMKKLKIVRPH